MLMPDKSYTFFNCDHDAPGEIVLQDAKIAYFTSRSPAKTTPNEDSSAIIQIDDGSVILIVADGLGGMPEGEIASRLVIEELQTSLQRVDTGEVHIRGAILDGLEQANHELISRTNGSATTVAIAVIENRTLRTYHAGDSLILLTGNKGKIKTQTVSHSPIGYALESGLIDESEAMQHSERHLISNYIGTPEMRVEMGPVINLSQRDTLLLSSDGLSDNLYDDEIIDTIRKGPLLKSAKNLAAHCRENMLHPKADRNCHPDDLSFILFRLDHPD